MSRTKVWVGLICLLLVFYLVVMVQQSIWLLQDPNWTAKGLAAAYLVLPLVGAWAMIREILFGVRTERLARILEAEGGLPVDDLPRTPGGRIVRAAADEAFAAYQAETEEAPDSWRSWFRLSCAYDASGDRTMARRSMRRAIQLFSTTG
jgi:hypothetical protein